MFQKYFLPLELTFLVSRISWNLIFVPVGRNVELGKLSLIFWLMVHLLVVIILLSIAMVEVVVLFLIIF